MKYFIIMILFVLVAAGQTREPQQLQFNLLGDNIHISGDLDYFKINSFTLGWMWGGAPKISRSLFVNQADVSTAYELNLPDSVNLFIHSHYWLDQYRQGHLYSHCKYDNSIYFTKSLTYDPSLYLNPSDPRVFNKRQGDPSNPIFGFLTKSGTLLSDSSDYDYSRLVLNSSNIGDTVLKDPWPSNLLTYYEGDIDSINKLYSGRSYYVSFNLRRIGSNIAQDDTPVLKITVPYIYIDPLTSQATLGFAKFDSIPKDLSINDFYSLANNRGNIRKLKVAPTNDSCFYITRKMLPLSSIDSGDVTISALIDFSIRENILLKSSTFGQKNEIDSLKISIIYLGGCDVAIDWVRFETPNTRYLLHGCYDDFIINGVQTDLTNLSSTTYSNRGIFPKRFVINVESSPINWASERYFRKLVGDIITGSSYITMADRYDHHIDPADKWLSYSKIAPQVGAPFCEKNVENETLIINGKSIINSNHWKIMGLYQGRNKYPYPNSYQDINFDVFNSEYETFLKSGLTSEEMRTASLATYRQFDNVCYGSGPNGYSVQAYFEHYHYIHYLDALNKSTIFSDIPWFAQHFVENFLKTETFYDVSDSAYHTSLCTSDWVGGRLQTAEEFRLFTWSPIMMGAKGMLYDGDCDNLVYDDLKIMPADSVVETRIPNFNNMNNLDYLLSDLLDADYLDSTYDHMNILNRVYNLNTVSSNMGVPSTRIFMGKKSIRKEMYKLHQWIRQVEDDLMKLRLQAWYGYGYKLWYKQHPRFTQDSILWSYINPDSIKTRKLFDVDASGYKTTPPDYESTYDTFCDVTLLSDSNDLGMRSSFILGAQNRRTDPLIYFEEDTINRHILFLSTAEFDYLCKYGGKNPLDTAGPVYADTIWQKYYNRKFGCREITIPFNYVWDSQNPEDYVLLHIRELGGDDSLLNVQDWRKDYNYDRVDTIIGQDKNLVIRLQPGEGKLMVVTVLPPPTLTGKLDYSNQRKLIAFPVDSANTYAYDSIRYHLVYHAVDPASNKIRVYYRRSLPVTRTSNTAGQENVIWLPTIADSLCLSMVIAPNCEAITYDTTRDCAYPSIVVRKDEDGVNRAFVVFSCWDNDSLSIVEAKIDIDSPNASFPTPRIIQRISGSDMDHFGTPMINAADDGNFYTWSDSTLGIGIGFKSTMTYCFNTSDLIYKKFQSNREAKHPSLNSYSRIDQNENQCGLVWQEEFTIPNPPLDPLFQSEICHSRVRWTRWGIVLDSFNLPSPINFASFNTDSTVFKIGNSIGLGISKFPVVYRGLDGSQSNDFDRIAWYDEKESGVQCKGEQPYSAWVSAIKYLPILSVYAGNIDSNYITNPRMITPGLTNPDLTFGANVGNPNTSDSAIVLECSSHEVCDPSNYHYKTIWHIPHSFTTFLSGSSYTPDQLIGLTNARQLTGNGYLSHLAARQFQDGPEDWWKNRRVFMESDSSINDSLKTSAQAFYKGKREKLAIPFIGFYNYYASSFVSPFYIDGELIRFDVKDMFRTDCSDCRGKIIPDTIKTDWFRVTEANNLDYFIKGYETENVEMLLERKSNRQTVRVNVPRLSDTSMIPIRNLLINGRNNEYRLLFTKLDRFNYYTENLVIMEDPFEPIFRKRGGFDNIIDLGVTEYSDQNDYLSIYPNPAEDKVFVTISKTGAGSCRIELISALGQVVLTGSANISSSAEINIQGISPGLYIIRALLPNGEVLQNSFVLSR